MNLSQHTLIAFCMLLTFSLFSQSLPAQGLGKSTIRPGDVILKTNPVLYVYPQFNLSLELGVVEDVSVDIMGGYFLGGQEAPFYGMINSSLGEGFLGHVMYRSYAKSGSGFFLSLGLLFKKWSYSEAVYAEGDFVNQDRKLHAMGTKFLTGWQLPFIKGSMVFEAFGGLSVKLRYDQVRNEYTYASSNPQSPSSYERYGLGMGLNLGFAIGPAFRSKRFE